MWTRFSIFFEFEGRDEKGCLLSTEKKAAVDVDVDRRPSVSTVEKCRMVYVDQYKSPAYSFPSGRRRPLPFSTGRRRPSCSFLPGRGSMLVDPVDAG